jgi:Domain of unknown function (DUF6468)
LNAVPIAVLVDGLIAALLLITICFCIALYRRLGMLRLEEHRLRATIADLARASRRAEAVVAGLRKLTEGTERTLDARAKDIAQLIDEIEDRTATARVVLTRIVAISRAVRPDAPRAAVARRTASSEEEAA